jgi:chemotaxis protein histidine kinase CheA
MRTISTTTSSRVGSIAVISNAIGSEIKRLDSVYGEFADAPDAVAISPIFKMLSLVADYGGFWGVGNYLKALEGLSSRIEKIPPKSVDRNEYRDRIKTLVESCKILRTHLNEIATGKTPSYTLIGEQYGKLMKKIHPSWLEIEPKQLAKITFMPAPPSLEVDVFWIPSSDASHQGLVDAMNPCVVNNSLVSAEVLDNIAIKNPYRSLSGFFEALNAVGPIRLPKDLRVSVLNEIRNLHKKLLNGNPLIPPSPSPEVFSWLLHVLARSPSQSDNIIQMRKRYSLMTPNTEGVAESMHDVARSYAAGMDKLKDAYQQAAHSASLDNVRKLLGSVSSKSSRLDSPAFATFAQQLKNFAEVHKEVNPNEEVWVLGAGLVLLLKESAQSWAHEAVQDQLLALSVEIEKESKLITAKSMIEASGILAIQKACFCLTSECKQLTKEIEHKFHFLGSHNESQEMATQFIAVICPRLSKFMDTAVGFLDCIKLSSAARFAKQLQLELLAPVTWISGEKSVRAFEGLSILQVFIERLRPGSLLDMQPEEIERLESSSTHTLEKDHVSISAPLEATLPESALPSLELNPPEEGAFNPERVIDTPEQPKETTMDVDRLYEGFISAGQLFSDVLDTRDPELLSVMFDEIDQCLNDVGRIIGQWRSQAHSDSLEGSVAKILRHVHTLKGVARTCGMLAIGASLHAMESDLENTPDDGVSMAASLGAYERLVADIRERFDRVRSDFQSSKTLISTTEFVSKSAAKSETKDLIEETAEPEQIPAQKTPVQKQIFPRQDPARAADAKTEASVRVPIRLAAKVGATSGKIMMASRRSAEDLERSLRSIRDVEGNLKRVGVALRELDMMAATGITSRSNGGGSGGFDALELDRYTALQEVVRRLKEAHEDCLNSAKTLSESIRQSHRAEDERAQLTEDMQKESSALTMVSVDSAKQRLERVVAKACEDSGKMANLVIESRCRAPAAVLDKLMPVFEHLLRNAVAHGIEPAGVRVAAGKNEVGTITIGAPNVQSSDESIIRICVRDDGAGVNHQKILAVAKEKGLATAVQYTDTEIREFLFMSGFSTASDISQLAGRGVGLDVVRSSISMLGGMVLVSSVDGVGSEFTVVLPTDTSSMSVIPALANGRKCLIPLTMVARIVPVSSNLGVAVNLQNGVVKVGEDTFKLIRLADKLGRSSKDSEPTGRTRGYVILMRESDVTTAVLVDAIGSQSRMVVRPLGPFVKDIPGMVAGAELQGGETCLVVNPLRMRDINRTHEPEIVASPTLSKTIMVVDDSSTVRLVTTKFLRRLGFDVVSAKDGLEALRYLSANVNVDGFIFDLEMPGMDGFELMAEVRRNRVLSATPIIVISSRTAQKHRDKAQEMGANAYLAKPYEDQKLQEVLEGLIGLPYGVPA